MNRFAISSIIVLTLFSNIINAAVIIPGPAGSNIHIQIVDNGPVGDGAENLNSYTVNLVGENGATPGGFQGGFTGIFHQQGFQNPFPPIFFDSATPFTDNAGTTVANTLATSIDSHFLIDQTDVPDPDTGGGTYLIISAPTETQRVSDSGEAADAFAGSSTSFGDSLTFTGAKIADFTPTWSIAQLVVPNNQPNFRLFDYDFIVTGTGIPGEISFNGVAVIPEPSAMLLLSFIGGMFGIGIIVRQHRKKPAN